MTDIDTRVFVKLVKRDHHLNYITTQNLLALAIISSKAKSA